MSYTLLTTAAPNNSTNALFEAWGQRISNTLANCGWVQATGVGTQINWATAPTPNATNQSIGYEIWQMNDSLQNTTPIYLKIEYGSGGGAAQPGLWVTLGAGANSSGNITGNTSTRVQASLTGSSATVYNCYFSGANNRFAMAMYGSSYALIVGVERTLDANGTPTSTGATLMYGDQTTIHNQVSWTPAAGNTTAWETSWGFLTPDSTVNSGAPGGEPSATQLAYYPCFFTVGGPMAQGSLFPCYFNGDTVTGTAVTLPFGNTTMTFMPLGNTFFYSASVRGTYKTALMMRWD
jgi:hypothetical protein